MKFTSKHPFTITYKPAITNKYGDVLEYDNECCTINLSMISTIPMYLEVACQQPYEHILKAFINTVFEYAKENDFDFKYIYADYTFIDNVYTYFLNPFDNIFKVLKNNNVIYETEFIIKDVY